MSQNVPRRASRPSTFRPRSEIATDPDSASDQAVHNLLHVIEQALRLQTAVHRRSCKQPPGHSRAPSAVHCDAAHTQSDVAHWSEVECDQAMWKPSSGSSAMDAGPGHIAVVLRPRCSSSNVQLPPESLPYIRWTRGYQYFGPEVSLAQCKQQSRERLA